MALTVNLFLSKMLTYSFLISSDAAASFLYAVCQYLLFDLHRLLEFVTNTFCFTSLLFRISFRGLLCYDRFLDQLVYSKLNIYISKKI